MTTEAISNPGIAAAAAPDAGVDLVGTIEASALLHAPFDHICMEGVFSPVFYRRLLDSLPETRYYRELRHRDAMQADGHSTRREFYLFPEHIRLLPAEIRPALLEVSRAVRSPATQDAFKRKFRDQLERRFGRGIAELSFYPIPILVRDFGGYRIAIHDDSGRKAITVQFYLPRDESQAHLGTIFHEGREGEAAQRIKPLKFRPATGYAFPVAPKKTWHSVARTSPADGVRNSLMLTYYVQDNPLDRFNRRSKRTREFVRRFFRD